MKTKIEQLRELMARGDWNAAIIFCAKFPRLGAYRDAILDGREAILRPDFQRQLGREPSVLIAAAEEALREGWGA